MTACRRPSLQVNRLLGRHVNGLQLLFFVIYMQFANQQFKTRKI
jgi:hypothetical protein